MMRTSSCAKSSDRKLPVDERRVSLHCEYISECVPKFFKVGYNGCARYSALPIPSASEVHFAKNAQIKVVSRWVLRPWVFPKDFFILQY